MAKMKILLIGAAGFTGKEVLNILLESPDKYEVTAVLHNRKPELTNASFETIQSDFRDLTVEQLAGIAPDLVVHLARINSTRFRSLGRYFAAIRGRSSNKILLDNLNRIGKPVKLIYLSGSLMYGPGSHSENALLNPYSFARQYHHAETPFLNPYSYPNIEIKLIRVPWLLGFGSWYKSFYHDVARKTNAIPTYSPDDFKMMLMDVKDCAVNLLRVGESEFKGTYNLFMPGHIRYDRFTELMSESYGLKKVSFDRSKIDANFEKAVVEAFNGESLLTTIHTDLQQQLVFSYSHQEEMLKKNLLLFAKNK